MKTELAEARRLQESNLHPTETTASHLETTCSWSLSTCISRMTLRTDQLPTTSPPSLQTAPMPMEMTSVRATTTCSVTQPAVRSPYVMPPLPVGYPYHPLGYTPYLGVYGAAVRLRPFPYPYPMYASLHQVTLLEKCSFHPLGCH